MKLNEKYFLNSLLSVAPRCALLPSVVGAYNSGYMVPLRFTLIFAPLRSTKTLYSRARCKAFEKTTISLLRKYN